MANPMLLALAWWILPRPSAASFQSPPASPPWQPTGPGGTALPFSMSYPTDQGMELLLLAALFFAWLLTATPNISGPLRYGMHTYSPVIAEYIRNPPGLLPYALFLFVLVAVPRWWYALGAAVAWQYVREEHREAVARIRHTTRGACVLAASAEKHAATDAAAATRYEEKALDLAAKAHRDARYAEVDDRARDRERWNKERLVNASNLVAADAAQVVSAAREAAEQVEVARQCSDKAVTAAEEGRMEAAETWTMSTDEAVKKAILDAERAGVAKDGAKNNLKVATE